jgi:septal ring factor EnvC (AmiA/AmiB activator)
VIWDALTAIGTIAVAVTAVGIAIWGERRTDRRIRDERERSDELIAAEHARADRQLAEERALADKRLADQLAHSDAQLATERAAADARLKEELAHADAERAEEHRIAREREQWAEAYAVEVIAVQMSPEVWGSRVTTEPDVPIACPAAALSARSWSTAGITRSRTCTRSSARAPAA